MVKKEGSFESLYREGASFDNLYMHLVSMQFKDHFWKTTPTTPQHSTKSSEQAEPSQSRLTSRHRKQGVKAALTERPVISSRVTDQVSRGKKANKHDKS